MWDPSTYLRYTDERSRPFFDLLARVDTTDPKTVVDLGCGPGTLTTHLAQRWPTARVIGVDSSPDMIAAAQRQDAAQATAVRFEVADFRATTLPPADLVLANLTGGMLRSTAALLSALVAPGGRLVLSGFDGSEADEVRGAFAHLSEVRRIEEESWVAIELA